MDIVEAIAIIILVLAIVFLVYYYLQNVNGFNVASTSDSIKGFFSSATTPSNNGESSSVDINVDGDEMDDKKSEEKRSTVDKIKYSFEDVNSAVSSSTDAFSKRLDSFLDEKSEELIESWSLVTTNDLATLEERCELACNNIDELEKRFSEYSSVTNERLDDIDKRLKALEDDE